MSLCIKCGGNESTKGRKICNSCIYKQKKKSNPIRIAYASLKGHAKERGKDFNLSIKQFSDFCIKSNYLNCKGIQKFSFHVDRIDETKGYNINNIQLLKNIDNVRKYINFVEINRDGKKIFKTNVSVDLKSKIIDAPF